MMNGWNACPKAVEGVATTCKGEGMKIQKKAPEMTKWQNMGFGKKDTRSTQRREQKIEKSLRI